jgi:GNAT superfamily N-acetyltransferase
MVRQSLADLPEFAVPAGFALRWHAPGDAANWLRIWQAADAYQAITPDRFEREFGPDPSLWAERQCFLCDASGAAVGTATAWFDDDYFGRRCGRVHWVAVRPPFQGRGLSKPLLAATCRRLRELGHDCAYLVTETVRLPAIRLYWQFGFRPDLRTGEDFSRWREVQRQMTGLDLGVS